MSGVPAAAPIAVPDHLVVAAHTLDAGIAWCEATLGVRPETGGRHAAMGTHNAVLALDAGRYLEIIAVDPAAPPPGRRRWFDLDTADVQEAIEATPRLVHWVARTGDIAAGVAALRSAGHDVGAPFAAERPSPARLLRWRISLTDDGRRPAGGAVPLLIAWGTAHPCDALPDRGVTLESIVVGGLAPGLAERLGVAAGGIGAPALAVTRSTPNGRVERVGVEAGRKA